MFESGERGEVGDRLTKRAARNRSNWSSERALERGGRGGTEELEQELKEQWRGPEAGFVSFGRDGRRVQSAASGPAVSVRASGSADCG